jgi:hypothetical protein
MIDEGEYRRGVKEISRSNAVLLLGKITSGKKNVTGAKE